MTDPLRAAIGLESGRPRDDRILPLTRLVGAIIAPVLLGAFIILWGMPDRTTELFAWTIRPDMTPLVMGAGYGTGVYFFYRVVTVGEWHRVAPVFPGIAVFTWFMAAATALHWANFNHDHVSFWLWAFLYVVSPFLIPALWVLNRRTTPAERSGGKRAVPRPIRRLGGVSGVAIVSLSVVLFLVPEVMIAAWPWNVSPLTTRILLGWFALLGTVNLVAAFEPRWSGWHLPVQTQILGLGLVVLGAVRAFTDFDATSPYTWAVLAGMSAYLLGATGFYVWMERR